MKKLSIFTAAAFIAASMSFSITSENIEFTPIIQAQAMSEKILASGAFEGVDTSHQGRGIAKLVQAKDGKFVLELSEDFNSTPGPDLKVYLVQTDKVETASDVTGNKFISLGALQSSSGKQSYELPEGVNPKDFGSAVIFCQQYSVLFSSASLENEM